MVISVGANLEDPHSQVRRAMERLRDEFEVVALSSIYRTTPVGRTDQPEFCNAIVLIDDDRSPHEVLHLLHGIEDAAGRVRSERWGPRVLDLDLVIAGDIVSDDPACTLPHPRAHERAFVLVPWAEIDPDAEIPGHGRVRSLIAHSEGEVR